MSEAIRIRHVDDEPEFAELTVEFLTREDDNFASIVSHDLRNPINVAESPPRTRKGGV